MILIWSRGNERLTDVGLRGNWQREMEDRIENYFKEKGKEDGQHRE